MVRLLLLVLLTFGVAAGQSRPRTGTEPPEDERLPGGKSRNEEILKQDHKNNLSDLEEIKRLAESIREELEKTDRHVLSVSHLRKLEEVERISRRIRGRMRRF
jgi:hypothetical protein